MNRIKDERFIILLVSLAGIGLIAESMMRGWEFWVPPLIAIGIVSMWVMQISGRPDHQVRKNSYLIFVLLTLFFHGVHANMSLDIAIIMALAMVVLAFLDSVYMMHLLLAEYFVLLGVQFLLGAEGDGISLDRRGFLRLALQIMIFVLTYFCCVKSINDRLEMIWSNEQMDKRIEAVDSDMEDFLSNISHELRTPVNVVNGMAEMLIKKNAGSEAFSVKNAGIRLAYQIEDIQDYTECKRRKIILEEDNYESMSLIQDVVMGFRMFENERNLELIVDLDPKVPQRMRGDVKKLHKIFRHLLENAIKFTRHGGIYVKLYAERMDYGVNLCIEMTDTGIGMDRQAVASLSRGMYQVNKKRNRSTGGVGLGFFIVYGFVHRMGGFVRIESEKRVGTMVRITIPQTVTDESPCLALSKDFKGDILFHVRSDKYQVPRVRDFYRSMAANLATGIRASLYPTQTVREIEKLREKLDVTVIFMGQEEYEENSDYFDKLSREDVVVAVSASEGFRPNEGSNVLVMPKPLYAYPVIKVLNEGREAGKILDTGKHERPVFRGVRALVVDDEPMNLIVATSLFKDYEMVIDTAESGRDALNKFRQNEYDVIFMDHMMPEMDGVEAMKLLKSVAAEMHKSITVIALTANAVSGAREMFMAEGFDGFIAKPINIADFERVMLRELPTSMVSKGGQGS